MSIGIKTGRSPTWTAPEENHMESLRQKIDFVKMEGIGNDYIYIDSLTTPPPILTGEQIRHISDRRRGIGSDGVVIISQSTRAAAKMNMWNSDGSRSAMCGNALRCIALYVANKFNLTEFQIESDSGLHRAKIVEPIDDRSAIVEVEIGTPSFASHSIPFRPELLGIESTEGPYIGIDLKINPLLFPDLPALHGTLVSMGNPHCVIFVDDVERFPVEAIGLHLENHPAFPEKTNVEFVSRDRETGLLRQRTHERGSGETHACGSGACAVLVASVLNGSGKRKETVQLLGGKLEVEWSAESNTVTLRGMAHIVYAGTIWIQSPP